MNENSAEHQYLNIMKEIIEVNESTPDRTGTGRIRLFCRDIRVDLSDGTLPVLTTRKIRFEHGINELLWMIKGSHNLKDLADNTKVIWDGWSIKEKDVDAFIDKYIVNFSETFGEEGPHAREALKNELMKKHMGSIGPMYGHFWRNAPSTTTTGILPFDSLDLSDIPSDKLKKYQEEFDELTYFHKLSQSNSPENTDELPKFDQYAKRAYFESNDQLGEIIRGIRTRPFSARHCMSVWIPEYLPFESVMSPQENVLIGRGALAPCHVFTHFFVEKANDGGPHYLSLRILQRSCDWALGVATNLVFYATLLHLVAHCTKLRVKTLVWSGDDCHLYANHLEMAKLQVTRTPFPSPTIKINPEVRDLFQITREDITVENYVHHEHIKYDVSI